LTSQVILLSNGVAEAAIMPDIGGRIISFKALGREWLWQNPKLLSDAFEFLAPPEDARLATNLGEWWNWGGDKSWPAPQGWTSNEEWAGPPDPILDSGSYAIALADSSSCHLKSPPDPRTGLQIERTISMSPGLAGLSLTTKMTNTSMKTSSWACWTVTQVKTNGNVQNQSSRVVIEQSPKPLPHVSLFEAVGKPLVHLHNSGQLDMPIQDFVGKLGFPSASGQIKLIHSDGSFFQQSFKVHEKSTYTDGGSRAQVWMQFPVDDPIDSLQGLTLDARLVELECLSPLTELAPGESVSLKVEWLVGEGA
jgi:hypothetical protein